MFAKPDEVHAELVSKNRFFNGITNYLCVWQWIASGITRNVTERVEPELERLPAVIWIHLVELKIVVK
jgi:hypothetical protein